MIRWLALASLLGVLASPAAAQPPVLSPQTDPGPFVYQATLPRGGSIWLSGDTALVGQPGTLYVFDRDPATDTWHETAPIILPASVRTIDFDGRTILAGGGGSASIIRRNRRGVWREVVRLTPADGNTLFGGSVAIHRGQAVVGAPKPFDPAVPDDSSAVYIFERQAPGVWTEVKKLESTSTGISRTAFGNRVDITTDAMIVQEATRFNPIYIFERNLGGAGNWGLARKFSVSDIGGAIAIEGDTAVATAGDLGFSSTLILNRNQGGPGAWGNERLIVPASGICCGPAATASISGDRVTIGTGLGMFGRAFVLGRNQGGTNAWGTLAGFFRDPPLSDGQQSVILSKLSGDSLLLYPSPQDVSYVYAADTDRDGLRDGIDPCPRDPLNRTDKHCRRDIESALAVDSLVTVSNQTTDVQSSQVTVRATYTNSSTTPIRNPFFAVTQINDGAVLLNGDGLVRGVASTLSPDVGDGILSPGETVDVAFQILLTTPAPLEFRVSVMGS